MSRRLMGTTMLPSAPWRPAVCQTCRLDEAVPAWEHDGSGDPLLGFRHRAAQVRPRGR